MEEDEDVICPLCKHEMFHRHMQFGGAYGHGVYGYADWWECDWCGYATHPQEHTFTAKETQ